MSCPQIVPLEIETQRYKIREFSLDDIFKHLSAKNYSKREYLQVSYNITQAELEAPNFILDERSRELYWECHRRTDLIRFGQFSDQGVWQWKGGVQQGVTTESFRDLMPIPATDLGLNTNLIQNPGY